MARKLTHTIDISESAGVRYLHFGSDWVQGAMRIARPWSLELSYTRDMMISLLLHSHPGWPANVLLIGLGAASMTKFIYRNFPDCHITVVEINPDVVAAARQFFRLPDDPGRLDIVIDDGATYIADNPTQRDLILVDGFGADARAGTLESSSFYRLCRQRLAPEGIMACNLLGRNRGFDRVVRELSSAFDGRSIIFPSGDNGNAIALCCGCAISCSLADLKDRASALRQATHLDLAPTIARLQQGHIFRDNCLQL